jgi:hypothetical protein
MTVERIQMSHDKRHKFKVVIDGMEVDVPHAEVSGRLLLEAVGKRPPDEYIIYQLTPDNVLEDLGLDRVIDIQESGIERFLTFKSDRSFRFEIDGKREDWACPTITEETIRKLAGADAGVRVWLEQKAVPDRLIHPGESVDLTTPGIEKFYMERSLTVEIINEENGAEFKLAAFKEDKLKDIIDRMYERLGVPRRGDDRLRCENPAEDVFGFAQLSLAKYLEAGHCRCLVWCFAGGTGGAGCR